MAFNWQGNQAAQQAAEAAAKRLNEGKEGKDETAGLTAGKPKNAFDVVKPKPVAAETAGLTAAKKTETMGSVAFVDTSGAVGKLGGETSGAAGKGGSDETSGSFGGMDGGFSDMA